MNRKRRTALLILISAVLVFAVLITVSANTGGRFNMLYKTFSSPFIKIQKALSGLGSEISGKISYLKNYDEITEKIKKLEDENTEIGNAISENEILKKENEELRTLLELKEYYTDYKLVAANVIAEDVTDWYNEFTVDVGTKSGVSEGDPVITSAGLVGIVSQAGPDSAKIMTIVDEKNVIMCRISRSNELVRLRGVSTENYTYEMRLDRISTTADLYVGDTIITAESGGVYPKGIKIGVVSSISTMSGTETRYASVVPFVNLNSISEVIILTGEAEQIPETD